MAVETDATIGTLFFFFFFDYLDPLSQPPTLLSPASSAVPGFKKDTIIVFRLYSHPSS